MGNQDVIPYLTAYDVHPRSRKNGEYRSSYNYESNKEASEIFSPGIILALCAADNLLNSIAN